MASQIPVIPQPEPIAPSRWSKYMGDLYATRGPPPLGTVDLKELEDKAREKMKDLKLMDAYMYTNGSAGTNSTYDANLREFKKWAIVPRMLTNNTQRNLEVNIFGKKYDSPILLAPIGVQGICHPDGELASARAAGKVGVPFIMSTASTRSIEAVAEANGPNADRWYQLYWPRTPEITLSILSRAKKSGFSTLVLTLDTPLLGWRPHDIETAYLPFLHGVGIQVGASDPVFMARFGLPADSVHAQASKWPYDINAINKKHAEGDEEVKTSVKLGVAWLGETNSGTFRTWEDVKFLRDNWEGKLVLKGIQSVGDAENAISIGVDGIVVSNHGGRQIDGAVASLYALDKICQSPTILEAQKSGEFTVLFDSGIRTGSDVIKALALGAQGVFLGRPYIYGLMIDGETGVEQVVRSTLADLEVTLGLSGYKNLGEVQGHREVLARVEP